MKIISHFVDDSLSSVGLQLRSPIRVSVRIGSNTRTRARSTAALGSVPIRVHSRSCTKTNSQSRRGVQKEARYGARGWPAEDQTTAISSVQVFGERMLELKQTHLQTSSYCRLFLPCLFALDFYSSGSVRDTTEGNTESFSVIFNKPTFFGVYVLDDRKSDFDDRKSDCKIFSLETSSRLVQEGIRILCINSKGNLLS